MSATVKRGRGRPPKLPVVAVAAPKASKVRVHLELLVSVRVVGIGDAP